MDGLFYFMEYIAVRNFTWNPIGKGVGLHIKKRAILSVSDEERNECSHFPACTLKLDQDLFMTAFHSSAYMSWLRDFARDIDNDRNPLYPGLTRCPETLMLYLRDIGVSSDRLLKAMFGPFSSYQHYYRTALEFGQTVIE
jgi:hypothetical protein